MQSDEEYLKSHIKRYENFKKKGLNFVDATTLVETHECILKVIQVLENTIRNKGWKCDYIAAVESKGFLVGTTLANKLGCGFIPICKKGSLPGKTLSIEYEKLYEKVTYSSKDALEISASKHYENKSVVVFDDVCSSGSSSVELLKSIGFDVTGVIFLVELLDVNGRSQLKVDVESILKYESQYA